MRLLHEIAIFQIVKSKVIISLFETVRLSVSISLRNLYDSLNSIKETPDFLKQIILAQVNLFRIKRARNNKQYAFILKMA